MFIGKPVKAGTSVLLLGFDVSSQTLP